MDKETLVGPGMLAKRTEAIIEAAVVRFVRQGYRRTSMDDLAQDLGIGKGTLYLSFQSKAALYAACLGELQRWIIERATQAAALPRGSARDSAVLQALYGDPHAVTSQGPAPWLDEGPQAAGLSKARLRVLEAVLAPLAGEVATTIDAACRGLRRGLDGAVAEPAAYRTALQTVAIQIAKLR